MTAESTSASAESVNVVMFPNTGPPVKRTVVRHPADAVATDATVLNGGRIAMDFEGSEETTVHSVGFSGIQCQCHFERGADLGVVLRVDGRVYPSGRVGRFVTLIPTTSDDVAIEDFDKLITLDNARLGSDGCRRLGEALCAAADLIDELGARDRE